MAGRTVAVLNDVSLVARNEDVWYEEVIGGETKQYGSGKDAQHKVASEAIVCLAMASSESEHEVTPRQNSAR